MKPFGFCRRNSWEPPLWSPMAKRGLHLVYSMAECKPQARKPDESMIIQQPQYGSFLSHRDTPSSSRIFPLKHHPAIGDPPFMESHIWKYASRSPRNHWTMDGHHIHHAGCRGWNRILGRLRLKVFNFLWEMGLWMIVVSEDFNGWCLLILLIFIEHHLRFTLLRPLRWRADRGRVLTPHWFDDRSKKSVLFVAGSDHDNSWDLFGVYGGCDLLRRFPKLGVPPNHPF